MKCEKLKKRIEFLQFISLKKNYEVLFMYYIYIRRYIEY